MTTHSTPVATDLDGHMATWHMSVCNCWGNNSLFELCLHYSGRQLQPCIPAIVDFTGPHSLQGTKQGIIPFKEAYFSGIEGMSPCI